VSKITFSLLPDPTTSHHLSRGRRPEQLSEPSHRGLAGHPAGLRRDPAGRAQRPDASNRRAPTLAALHVRVGAELADAASG